MMRVRMIFVALAAAMVVFAQAQEVRGASQILEEAAKARAEGKKGPEEGTFKKAVEDFEKGWRKMSPADAAAGWLALHDRFEEEGQQSGYYGDFALLSQLPSPDSWSAIAQGLRQRAAKESGMKAIATRLLAEFLGGDAQSQWKEMVPLMNSTSIKEPEALRMRSQLYVTLAQLTQDKERIVRGLLLQANLKPSSYSRNTVAVPDLVSLVGAARAEQILTEILTTTKATLMPATGKDTNALLHKLVLQNVDKLKEPQFNLVEGPDDYLLYEKLVKKFPDSEATTEGIRSTKGVYVLGLMFAGRREDAVREGRAIKEGGYYWMTTSDIQPMAAKIAANPAWMETLRQIVLKNPSSDFWTLYVTAAYASKQTDQAIAALEETLKNPGSSAATLRYYLEPLLLATPRRDEVIASLRKRVQDGSFDSQDLTRLAMLGRLLEMSEWIDEAYKAALDNKKEDAYAGYLSETVGDLWEELLKSGRPGQAEALLLKDYKKALGQEYATGAPYQLAALARLYYRLNRPDDVLALMEKSPDWGMVGIESLSSYSTEEPFAYIAAWALFKAGRKPEAERLTRYAIATAPTSDPAYALLVEMRGEAALADLDALYALNQFEERPLIWKAKALKDLSRLEEAETTARKAISVDPSDGDQLTGNRLYAYALLADIREARGDKEEAAQLRTAVAAIRLAERADEFMVAGLSDQAIDMYKQSLQQFSDAYCIQSRLAVQLMAAGRTEEAEEHYRRAYELMPDSFGRVETHCFGCEGVFEGELSQSVAEQVFTKLLQTSPTKPQVHYLMGYLREEQGRTEEAVKLYEKAVELDPDYLNAWRHLATLLPTTNAEPAQIQRVNDAIVRLDATGQGDMARYNTSATDLKSTWLAAEKVYQARSTGNTGPIYTFPAVKKPEESEMLGRRMGVVVGDYAAEYQPGAVVMQHELISNLIGILQYSEESEEMAQSTSGRG